MLASKYKIQLKISPNLYTVTSDDFLFPFPKALPCLYHHNQRYISCFLPTTINELSPFIIPPDPFIILPFTLLIIFLSLSDKVNNKAVLFVGDVRRPTDLVHRNAENSVVGSFYSWNGRPNQFTLTASTEWLLIYL